MGGQLNHNHQNYRILRIYFYAVFVYLVKRILLRVKIYGLKKIFITEPSPTNATNYTYELLK